MQTIFEILINFDIYAFIYIANLFKQCNYKFMSNFSQR